MIKVKMHIQTQYKDQLLRADKIYLVPTETAERWQQSKIAEIVSEEEK
ncbi:hypothetical protein J2T56_000239 [Natronobacillus azotifigens]|uniref:Uncharacterized protein n=1 Tax=Natronobacillus azotifigens TaxID=472978 RepID=A0A9J6R8V3_9BACI|nr:hypothetical protein [Natronobacillus azotifigens]MCZ0701983.1 hypothetical protein [Natronobacillus azotifigens]